MATPLKPEQAKRQLDLVRFAYKGANGQFYTIDVNGNRAVATIGSPLADGTKVQALSQKYQEIAEQTAALVMTLSTSMVALTPEEKTLLQQMMDGKQTLDEKTEALLGKLYKAVGKQTGAKNPLQPMIDAQNAVAGAYDSLKAGAKLPFALLKDLWGNGATIVEQLTAQPITEENAIAIGTAYASAREAAADERSNAKGFQYAKEVATSTSGWGAIGAKIADGFSWLAVMALKLLAGLLEAFHAKDWADSVRGWADSLSRPDKSFAEHYDDKSRPRDNNRVAEAMATLPKIGGMETDKAKVIATGGTALLGQDGKPVVVKPADENNKAPVVVNPAGQPVVTPKTVQQAAADIAANPREGAIVRLRNAEASKFDNTVKAFHDAGVLGTVVGGGAAVLTTVQAARGAVEGVQRQLVKGPEQRAEDAAKKVADLQEKAEKLKVKAAKLEAKEPGFFRDRARASTNKKLAEKAAEIVKETPIVEAKIKHATSRAGAEWHDATTVEGEAVHTKGNLTKNAVEPLNKWNPLNIPRAVARAVSARFTSPVEATVSWFTAPKPVVANASTTPPPLPPSAAAAPQAAASSAPVPLPLPQAAGAAAPAPSATSPKLSSGPATKLGITAELPVASTGAPKRFIATSAQLSTTSTSGTTLELPAVKFAEGAPATKGNPTKAGGGAVNTLFGTATTIGGLKILGSGLENHDTVKVVAGTAIAGTGVATLTKLGKAPIAAAVMGVATGALAAKDLYPHLQELYKKDPAAFEAELKQICPEIYDSYKAHGNVDMTINAITAYFGVKTGGNAVAGGITFGLLPDVVGSTETVARKRMESIAKEGMTLGNAIGIATDNFVGVNLQILKDSQPGQDAQAVFAAIEKGDEKSKEAAEKLLADTGAKYLGVDATSNKYVAGTATAIASTVSTPVKALKSAGTVVVDGAGDLGANLGSKITGEKVQGLTDKKAELETIAADIKEGVQAGVNINKAFTDSGVPNVFAYKQMGGAIASSPAEDGRKLSSDPLLSRLGVTNNSDPAWITKQIDALQAKLTASKEQKGIFSSIGDWIGEAAFDVPSEENFGLESLANARKELVVYTQQFNEWKEAKLKALLEAPVPKPVPNTLTAITPDAGLSVAITDSTLARTKATAAGTQMRVNKVEFCAVASSDKLTPTNRDASLPRLTPDAVSALVS